MAVLSDIAVVAASMVDLSAELSTSVEREAKPATAMNLTHRCRALVADVAQLTGGVSSDIARFTLGGRAYCTKFARAKLAVDAEWHAPVERGLAEYLWLQAAAAVAPQNALGLHGYSAGLRGFVMDCIAGDDVALRKDELLAGRVSAGVAALVADLFAVLHAASAKPDFDRPASTTPSPSMPFASSRICCSPPRATRPRPRNCIA